MPLDELAVIERYFRPLAGEGSFGLLDDAARLDVPPDHDLVVTTDMIAEGVHFLRGDPPDSVARKALRVNVSDLAAKGARPLAYVLGLGMSSTLDEAWLAAFAAGLAHDQRHFNLRLLGGDTIGNPAGVTISVTAFGLVPKGRMVHRAGGGPGDELFVSGTIGAARIGLALLRGEDGVWSQFSEGDREKLVERYRVPEPRPALAQALIEFASAAMDVSDGLVGDCDKLCTASGCSAIIEAESIPLPRAVPRPAGKRLLASLITGGDDYEILAAIPPDMSRAFRRAAERADVPVARIGALAEGREPARVIFQGAPLELSARAFAHGRVEESR